ncbi:trypsin beta-like isoform X2 [Argopecten irradians]|uniref:trypsin beta-like isoform X2 n=1 Tax=Argopecten irradians TaxID=31199 RepID=UPI00372092C4
MPHRADVYNIGCHTIMMNGLVLACALLVVESLALPKSAPIPKHPSEDLIRQASEVPRSPLIPRHPSQDLIDEAEQLTNSRIVGGGEATIRDNPWQVSLRSNNNHICGGVILNATVILTAAHCLGSSTHTSYSVRYGSGSRLSGGGISAATGMKLNANYGEGLGAFPNDIAILMVEDMTLSSNAAAISLNSRSNNALADLDTSSCRITGWGRTSGTSSLPTILQGTNVDVLTDSNCGSDWGNNLNGPVHICVSGDNSGACNGDSGGPLVCENNAGVMELVGVTSWGASGCSVSYPSVYTEVSYFHDFINTNASS